MNLRVSAGFCFGAGTGLAMAK